MSVIEISDDQMRKFMIQLNPVRHQNRFECWGFSLAPIPGSPHTLRSPQFTTMYQMSGL